MTSCKSGKQHQAKLESIFRSDWTIEINDRLFLAYTSDKLTCESPKIGHMRTWLRPGSELTAQTKGAEAPGATS